MGHFRPLFFFILVYSIQFFNTVDGKKHCRWPGLNHGSLTLPTVLGKATVLWKRKVEKERERVSQKPLLLLCSWWCWFFLRQNLRWEPVWPVVGVKSCPNVSTSCLKISTVVFTLIDLCQSSPKVNIFWVTFVNKIVAKNFKKSPNLVTLDWKPTSTKNSMDPIYHWGKAI